MATSTSRFSGRLGAGGLSGDVIGGAVTTALALIHLFGVQIGGVAGYVLLLVAWPTLGGAIGVWIHRTTGGDDWRTTSVVTGVSAAVVTTVVVFVTGFAGVWSGFITRTFGVALGPVVFTVLVLFTIPWAVFGYTGGFLAEAVASRRDAGTGVDAVDLDESGPATDAGAEPATDADAEPATDADAEPATDADAESPTGAETESVTDAETEAPDDSRTDPLADTETEATDDAATGATDDAETEAADDADEET